MTKLLTTLLATPLVAASLFVPLCSVHSSEVPVIINEIAWMGTETSAADEWIELYNGSRREINLEGWKLSAQDGAPEIDLTGKIPGYGFFLLERTDDSTVSGIAADLIYKGPLNNKGEYLKLINAEGGVVDEADCSEGWPFGDNKTKQTMERSGASTWQISQAPLGTPKQDNNNQLLIIGNNDKVAPTEAPTTTAPMPEEPPRSEPPTEDKARPEEPQPAEEPEELICPSSIFINEILPSPQGSDAENEWVELYNGNGFEVDLSNWQLKDTAGAVRTYTFPNNTTVVPTGFLVLLRTKTKITLQNSGDGLELLNPKGEIVHAVTYPKALLGQSYNKTPTGWAWSTRLTPERQNIIPEPEPKPAPVQQDQKYYEAKPHNIDSAATSADILTADIEKTLSEASGRILTFIFAVIIAVGSAVIVLFLKRKVSEQS